MLIKLLAFFVTSFIEFVFNPISKLFCGFLKLDDDL